MGASVEELTVLQHALLGTSSVASSHKLRSLVQVQSLAEAGANSPPAPAEVEDWALNLR